MGKFKLFFATFSVLSDINLALADGVITPAEVLTTAKRAVSAFGLSADIDQGVSITEKQGGGLTIDIEQSLLEGLKIELAG